MSVGFWKTVCALELLVLVGAWEDKWKRVTLSETQQRTAVKIAKDFVDSDWLISRRRDGLKGIVGGKKLESKNLGKYAKVAFEGEDAKQFKPLCKVFFWLAAQSNTKTYDTLHRESLCSCSFLAPRWVLLAAHCFTEEPAVTPESVNAIVVVPQYGSFGDDEKDFKDEWKKRAVVGIEWWLPAAWTGKWTAVDPQRDVAFIKTSKGAQQQTDFYRMMATKWEDPDVADYNYNLRGQDFHILGYPFEFKAAEAAVSVKGVVKKASDGTLWNEIDPKGDASLVGRLFKRKSKGGMEVGGSGGPWILDKDVPYKLFPSRSGLWEKFKAGVYSVTSYVADSEDEKLSRTTVGPAFTGRLIEVQRYIIGDTPPSSKPQVENKGDFDLVTYKLMQ